jgi:hypothetical protein
MAGLILGASWSDLGALLVGVGALLLLVGAVAGGEGLTGMTFGDTIATPERRLLSGMEVVGSVFAAVGSALLLFGSRTLGVLIIVLILITGAVLIYTVMAVRLRAHLTLVAKEGNGPRRSFWWCALHPRWRPPA